MSRKELILTNKYLYLIGREQIKKGVDKGNLVEVIKRKLSFNQLSHISLSTLQVSEFYYYCCIILLLYIMCIVKKRMIKMNFSSFMYILLF